jgi:hypothetical protein
MAPAVPEGMVALNAALGGGPPTNPIGVGPGSCANCVTDGLASPASSAVFTSTERDRNGGEWWAYVPLAVRASVVRVVVFPAGDGEDYAKWFPKAFAINLRDATGRAGVIQELQFPANAVFEADPVTGQPTGPVVFEFAAQTSRLPTMMQFWTDNLPSYDGVFKGELSEIAAFAVVDEPVPPVADAPFKPALVLEVGDEDQLPRPGGGADGPFEYSSSDESVVEVGQDGLAVAVGLGEALLEVSLGEEVLAAIPVGVVEHVDKIGEDYMISLMCPPWDTFTNDEQYDYLAEAGIDVIQNQGPNSDPVLGTGSREWNLEMARLSYERGMQVLVDDENLGPIMRNQSPETVRKNVSSYLHVPGVGGLNMMDEPIYQRHSLASWAVPYNAMREAAPDWVGYFNFSPHATETHLRDWMNLTGGVREDRYGPDYLMYDVYRFYNDHTGVSDLLDFMDMYRRVGLEYNVKTGGYINVIKHGSYRQTTATDVLWHANLQMAYGFKATWYFTWQTPRDWSGGAIIDKSGNKTQMYAPVAQVNSEIHALGPTLMRLDSEAVYLNGEQYGQASPVPGNFYAQPMNNTDQVLSDMVDSETGQRYLFVVNNTDPGNGTGYAPVDVELQFPALVDSLFEVSRVDGSLSEVELDGNVLSVELGEGEGVLYALPDVPGVEVDKSALEAAVVEASVLVESGVEGDYTAASWEALADALVEAEAVLADQAATQEQVDEAAAGLEEAVAGLVLRGPVVTASAVPKCTGTKAQLSVVVKNQEVSPVAVTVVSSLGSKVFPSVLGGKSASHVYTSGRALPAGVEVVVTATFANGAQTQTTLFPAAKSCAT